MDRFHWSGIKFEPRDIWVGLYWKQFIEAREYKITQFYICIVPMFPIIFEINQKWDGKEIR